MSDDEVLRATQQATGLPPLGEPLAATGGWAQVLCLGLVHTHSTRGRDRKACVSFCRTLPF